VVLAELSMILLLSSPSLSLSLSLSGVLHRGFAFASQALASHQLHCIATILLSFGVCLLRENGSRF
jgi:hypothetical protein